MTDATIDPAVFDDLSEAMGPEFVAELVTTFLDDAPNMLAELSNAMTQDDADAYRRAAHSIKSNAQVFGASALADVARSIELSDIETSKDSIPTLQAVYAETADALKALINA